jgi:hypothetical protein
MNEIFYQSLSSHTQHLTDTDLAGLIGGMEHGEIQCRFGLHFGSANKALPFSDDLQQLPVGAVDPHTVPWAELTPPVKKLTTAG